MLQTLSIKNFALIEDVNLQLQEGFSIITGETGAGKSILLGALSLLLGKRADLAAIRDSSKKCTIEGIFRIKPYNLKPLFKEENLDYEDHTIIRREILPSGKSRAFINDTPVNLSALQALGDKLVDIHSQHETLSLGNTEYQYLVLDTYADINDEVFAFQNQLQHLKALRKQLKALTDNQTEANKAYDYNLFLLEELEKANLKPGMLDALELRQEQLSNVELLKESLGETGNLIQEESTGILELLRQAKRKMAQIESMSTTNKEIYERIQSTIIELEDTAISIEREYDAIEDDPKSLEEINDALQSLYNLFKKHQVDSIEALLQIEETLADEVLKTQNADSEIAAINKRIQQETNSLKETASVLFNKRQAAKPKLLKDTKELLAELGMPNAEININITPIEHFTPYGREDMNWQLSANKGGQFTDIKKAASGGELSRIMLAVKSILATKSQLPTIIFDEIDTGVSGEIAKKMGDIMANMGHKLQVLSITHLPQIAAKGEHHFKVFKVDKSHVTVTQIKQLTTEERIVELAEMLGGKAQNDAVLAHAKSLLN